MSDIVGVVYGLVCWYWICPLDRVWKQLLAANIDTFSSLDLGDEPFWTIVFLGGSLRLKTPKGPCNLTGSFHSRYGMCEGWGWPCWVARLTDLGRRCWDRSIHTIWVGAMAADPTRIAIWFCENVVYFHFMIFHSIPMANAWISQMLPAKVLVSKVAPLECFFLARFSRNLNTMFPYLSMRSLLG